MARLDDGFSSTMSFALEPSVKLYFKTTQPPGVAAGGGVDTSTMSNTAWRTNAPKKLKTLTEAGAKCAYDPAVYNQIVAMVGKNQQITQNFSDGSTLKFYGWVDEFTPGELTEGEQPTADVKIIPSNQDGSGAEAGPTYTTPGATTTTTTGA